MTQQTLFCSKCHLRLELRGIGGATIMVCTKCDIPEKWEQEETEEIPFLTMHEPRED
jgi:hypothetical protein